MALTLKKYYSSKPLKFLSVAMLCAAILSSCSIKKYIPKDEKLYTGATIKIVSKDKVKKGDMIDYLDQGLRPIPNKKFAGFRLKLWYYFIAGENPTGKIKKWIKSKGEAPVYLSSVKPTITSSIIDALLFNMGVFNSHTEYEIIASKYKSALIYTSYIHKPYLFSRFTSAISEDSVTTDSADYEDNISYFEKKKAINDLIVADIQNSLIKAGDIYNLTTLKQERLRIDDMLKNKGYFYFNPDLLVFSADTNAVKNQISLKIKLKETAPENSLTAYKIRHISINQTYSLQDDTVSKDSDTQIFENIDFVGKPTENDIRPKVLSRSVYLKQNELYTRQNHTITLNRLMSMGNFKFVQVKFQDSDTTANGYLDVSILMTPMPNHTIRAEADLVTKSNSYTGPKLNASVLTRNTFGGAEQLNCSLGGSFEIQLAGKNRNYYAFSINPQIELVVPRIMAPFYIKPSNSIYVPKTIFTLSYNLLKRIGYYDMNTFQFIYGFKWKSNLKTEFEYNPVNLSYTSIGNKSDLFLAILAANPFLNKSYEEKFIPAGNFAYTYNEQMIEGKKTQYYLNFTAETAGNLFWLVKKIAGETPSATNPSRIAGLAFSQYAKFSVDGRVYFNSLNKNKLVLRAFAGIAKPFGNADLIPYTKQFFSGGPNSIRAFQINSLGPGTYQQSLDTKNFLQIGGDIKLEMNAEYRFNIYKYFKGALFVDAGNVWLHKSNTSSNGTPFQFSTFTNEIAVGTGFGVRMDMSFFIVRLDIATPLRKPWLPEGRRWITDYIKPGNTTWGSNNLMVNFAIGYPF